MNISDVFHFSKNKVFKITDINIERFKNVDNVWIFS